MQGSDFHVPGKNYIAQPGGQVVGGGCPVGTPGGRRPLGGMQPIRSNTTNLYPGINSNGQTVLGGNNIQNLNIQGTSIQSGQVLHSSSSEMGKQTHLPSQPPTISQVYAQNQSRSASQNNYYTTPRPQQPRNINHRNAQSGNQTQVVGMPGAGNGQQPPIFSHSSLQMSPSVYVQSQVPGLQPNPHQQNVYSMNSQMSMQFSGPPQRHQTHQNQYQYPSFPHAVFATPPNFLGYGPQPAGYFYHQPHGAQLAMRGNANAVGSNNQHVPTSLNNSQATALVSQGSLSQQPQASQAMHTISMPIPPTDIYSNFNNANANAPPRPTKKRTKAIIDIVNPITGRNISDEIYKDDTTTRSDDVPNKETIHTTDYNAEVVADFAARVAKLASESSVTNPPVTSAESTINTTVTTQNPFNVQTQDIDSKNLSKFTAESNISKTDTTTVNENKDSSYTFDGGIPIEQEEKRIITSDTKKFNDSLTSNIIQNALQNDSSALNCMEEQTGFENKDKILTAPQDIPSITNEKLETQPINTSFEKENVVESEGDAMCAKILACHETIHNTVEIQGKEIEQSDSNNSHIGSPRDVTLSNSADGKAMQKQKSKAKIKPKEANRKSMEKENISVVDMSLTQVEQQDPSSLIEIKVSQNLLEKEFDKEEIVEHTKDVKDKDNYESKNEQNIQKLNIESTEEKIISAKDEDDVTETKEKSQSPEKEISIEEEPSLNEVVDNITFYKNRIEADNPLSSIVAQKNDENSKVSSEILNTVKDAVENINLETTDSTTTAASATDAATIPASLKYTYSDDQWSPINTTGKKVYDRDFLMKLQNDPNSKIKPMNLPDLDVVLKDLTKIRNPGDMKLKEVNLNRHDSLFPGFAKSSLSAKVPPPAKKNHSGKPKSNKPNVIHMSFSLREDVKLRETENAWKPTRLGQNFNSEDQNKTEALYKRVRSVLNKLTPQKFETLVNQVRELQIDTQERLQGVIDLVFEKAVDEPSFSVAYALMCKELSNMQATSGDSKDASTANFRKLILTRCQTEFEKNTVDENARSEKLKEIEECSDPEKKKELQTNLEDEERRMRIKSVGNIRFIGELFKQNMLTCKIMHQCIRHLINQQDEENLECLCKLLTTIGKALETKNIDLTEYFKQMQHIANRKGKISSRIRFMLQDVIDLKSNKWIPRRDDSNPKTIDQIQKEAESERMDIQLNNASISTPRKDDRANDRKRNRGGPTGIVEDGWSHPVSRSRPVYSVEAAKLKSKPPSVDDMQLGSRSTYQWSKPSPPKMTTPNKFSYLEHAPESDKKVPISLPGSRSTGREYNRVDYKTNYDRNSRNNSFQSNSNNQVVAEGSRSQSLSMMPSSNLATQNTAPNLAELSDDEFDIIFKKFFEEYISGEEDMEVAAKIFKESFPIPSHVNFVREIINAVLEKSEHHLKRTSQLLQQILKNKFLSMQHFKDGLGEILEIAGDLKLDVPKFWKCFAKILVYPMISNDFTLDEMKMSLQLLSPKLRSDGEAAEFIAELLTEINTIKGSSWTAEKWLESGLQWNDFSDNSAKINSIIAEYKLENIKSSNLPLKNYANSDLDLEKIHDELMKLLKNSEFDDICNWIQVHVSDNVKAPKFIRTLMTAIIESSVEQHGEKWIFKAESFDKLQKLIQRYVDADEFLELQCLFAVQAYITKLNHPAGLLCKIMAYLAESNVLSSEAFLAWEKNEDPAEREGKSVALLSLQSLFTLLKEVDLSSGDEA